MTSLVLGAAGALVGSYIPGVGAAMGWMLGSAVGGMFAATGHIQDGPRLGDTKIQVSTYGKPIPLVYGKMRISGNIIWAQAIKETAHKHKVKVSPFKKIKYYTYTYSCSFAVSLCNTQISGISRIWADGKLIYDMASTNSAINATSAALKANMRIYLGTETQMPDALLGGDTAYRGQTYVVFENLQLEKYSNRIPMLEFEVCALSTISASIESANRLRITEILAGQQNGVAFNSTSNIVLDNNIIYLKSPQNGAIYQFSVDNPITPGYLGLYNPYPNETSPGQRAGGVGAGARRPRGAPAGGVCRAHGVARRRVELPGADGRPRCTPPLTFAHDDLSEFHWWRVDGSLHRHVFRESQSGRSA